VTNFIHRLKAKLPSRREALAVFAVIVFIVYSWAMYRTFWWVPSWLEYLSIWSILIIIAYVMAFALFESLAMMGLMVLLSLILPRRAFKDQFIVQGSALSVVLGLGAFLLQRDVGVIYQLELEQTFLYPALILVGVILMVYFSSFVFRKMPALSRLALVVAERMTVFVYLYVPLGLIGLLVVVLRNLW
jgi:hypothetical protein